MTTLRVAIVVISDRASAGIYEDRCLPALIPFVEHGGGTVVHTAVIPDGIDSVRAAMAELIDAGGIDLLLTAGGTGVAPRDLTPEATRPLIERDLPGIPEAMRAASLAITPHAILSRGLAGFRGTTLIVNLPGSPKGGVENLAAVWKGIVHGVAKAQGDPTP